MSIVQLEALGTTRRRARVSGAGPLVVLAVGLLALLVLAAAIAPLIAPHDPNAVNILDPLAGSSGTHLLGTDAEGRDLLSRLLYGARSSLLGPALVVVFAVTVGTTITVVSVWTGGWVDEVVTRLLDVMFAIPGLLLAIVATAIFGPGLVVCALALTIAYIPYMARLLRGPALKVRSQPYVAAYELQGFSGIRICTRHILPTLRPFIAAQATVAFGYALLDLAALSFLGLGVQAPTADWGVMVSSGEGDILRGYPEQALLASLLIVLTVVSVNIVGERVGRPPLEASAR